MNMSNFVPVKLAYETYEPVCGTDENLCPIIFLHGILESKEMWGSIPQIIANETKRKTYSVDARNHGDSEWSEVFDFDTNADDLLHFMDTMSVENAVLIGHSMGGKTIIKASLTCPQRIEMLIAEDIYVKTVHQKVLNSVLKYLDLCEKVIEQISPDWHEAEVQRFIANYLFDKSPADMTPTGSRESLDNMYFALKRNDDGRYAWKANFKVIQKALTNGNTLMSEPEGLFEGPAYFIYGGLSPMNVNKEEDHIRKFFPKSEFIPIEGSDHSIHVQFPNEFTEATLKCLLNHKT